MRIKTTVRSARGIRTALKGADEQVRQAAADALRDAADDVAARAQQLVLEPPKTGLVYKRGNTRHQASAPGEAPASDTGNLVNLIGVDAVDTQRLRVSIFSSAKYSFFLEFGTSKMAPRPFLRRALSEMGPRVLDHFRARGFNVR